MYTCVSLRMCCRTKSTKKVTNVINYAFMALQLTYSRMDFSCSSAFWIFLRLKTKTMTKYRLIIIKQLSCIIPPLNCVLSPK